MYIFNVSELCKFHLHIPSKTWQKSGPSSVLKNSISKLRNNYIYKKKKKKRMSIKEEWRLYWRKEYVCRLDVLEWLFVRHKKVQRLWNNHVKREDEEVTEQEVAERRRYVVDNIANKSCSSALDFKISCRNRLETTLPPSNLFAERFISNLVFWLKWNKTATAQKLTGE